MTDEHETPGFPQDIARRQLLKTGAVLAGAGLLFRPSLAFAKLTGPREVSLLNTHTGERLKAEYWGGGRYYPDALAAINHLLRDHYNGQVHAIDPHLLDLANKLQKKLGAPPSAPFHVISGYRSPATNSMLRRNSSGVARNSYHVQGKAMDIRMPGISLRDLHKAALSLHGGGVGYYASSNFVHMDVGPVRRW